MARFGIALTGGIGSGKSTVASIFARLGIEVIDTDEISRLLTSRNGPAINKIAEAFGERFVNQGDLDRSKMRKLVFSDESSRKKLESILHPMIRAEVEKRIGLSDSPYYLLVVPLFFETKGYGNLVKRVLVVDCSEKTQIDRAMKRSALNEKEVESIMKSQVSRKERLEKADDILENEGSIDMLEAKIIKLHDKYLSEYLKNTL